ncbi:Pentatricopeptide repeat-containing protein [Hibiscus syriacus]|uniref:Pentatricopeptide repeat-containing protein n=1 Tax=Hibiscus syriacus TaxID=106335 RepID=A0A6A2X7H9_HIBSY|nr:Pentatricopeptide repeat-containing protein [Hibiscus syriacus]
MSSQDSITTGLKCMLKGAADFLIKPVRRNELRNLWQHVWKRHMLAGGGVPLKLPATENNAETNAESESESSQFSDYGSSTQKNKEESDTKVSIFLSFGKGFDNSFDSAAQVLCLHIAKLSNLLFLYGDVLISKSTLESRIHDAIAYLRKNSFAEQLGSFRGEEYMQAGSSKKLLLKWVKNHFEMEVKLNVKEVACCSEACESDASKLEENPAYIKETTHGDGVGQQINRGNANATIRVGCNDELVKPISGAIDLIGSFNNLPKGTFACSSSSDGTGKYEFSPELELSLRRSGSSSSKNQGTSERPMLNHSNASAFSWYNNSKSSQPVFSRPAGNQDALKEDDNKSKSDLESNNDTSHPHVVTMSDSKENLTNPVTSQSELLVPSTQLELIDVPGLRMDDLHAGCNNAFRHVYYARSNPPLECSSDPSGRKEYSPISVSTSAHMNPDVHDPEQGNHRSNEATNCSIDKSVKEPTKQEPVRLLRCISPIANQSAFSSFCDGVDNHEKVSAHGDILSRSDAGASTTCAAAIDRGTNTGIFNDGNFFIPD